MYEDSNGSLKNAGNGTAPSHNAVMEPQRLRYSKDELKRLRTLVRPSPAFIQKLRSSLGSIANGEAGSRPISKLANDGRSAYQESRSASNSIASSPPSRFDDRLLQRDLLPTDVAAKYTRGNDDNESSARHAPARDLNRLFQPSPDGFLSARIARSPPSKRNDNTGAMFIRPDGNGSVASMSPENKQKFDLASSPSDNMFYGLGEYRRRSPSPRASPIGSPRASSPSGPPGFGPPPNQKVPGNQAPRALANGKVRICKGPNMQENFATRIAYKQRQLVAESSVAHSVKDASGIEDVNEKRDLIDLLLKAHEKVEGEPNSLPKHKTAEKVQVGSSVEMKKPPQINYTISSDISFEDFSKRLAAETGVSSVLENKFESDIIASLEQEGKAESLEDQIPCAETVEPYSGQNEQVSHVSDKEAMDELSKWFRSIAAASPDDADSGEAAVPESSVEEPTAEVPVDDERNKKEELDSEVLSFFDSIRSQALTERNSKVLDNGQVEVSDIVEDGTPQPPKELRSDIRPTQGFDDYDTTEVEQFFQLFTAGKPVYSSDSKPQAMANHDVSEIEKSEMMDATAECTASSSTQEPDSDSKGLERWFAALASANHIQ